MSNYRVLIPASYLTNDSQQSETMSLALSLGGKIHCAAPLKFTEYLVVFCLIFTKTNLWFYREFCVYVWCVGGVTSGLTAVLFLDTIASSQLTVLRMIWHKTTNLFSHKLSGSCHDEQTQPRGGGVPL